MNRLITCLLLIGWGASLGCSSLGFSTYPVAHLMTRETQRVLDASPRRPAVPRELRQEVLPVHYLQPGDELLIEATDFDATVRIPADQRVLADGTIDLDKHGRVVVSGMSLEQAEAAIQEVVAQSGDEATAINVRMVEPVDRYYVIGEVNSPGAYPLVGNETVLDGLMAAGGLTSRASACKMLLARPTPPASCRATLPVCYRAITQLGDTTTNYQLRPGDRIFVARQSMLEELLFWRAEATCSRCCNPNRPCADPSSIAGWGSNFGTPAAPWITPPAVPATTEAVESTLETPQEILPADLDDADPSADDPSADDPSADDPGADDPGADDRGDDDPGPDDQEELPSQRPRGELDFGAFLRRPTG